MHYTEEELLLFIERHDEHENYYRDQLAELRAAAFGVPAVPGEEGKK